MFSAFAYRLTPLLRQTVFSRHSILSQVPLTLISRSHTLPPLSGFPRSAPDGLNNSTDPAWNLLGGFNERASPAIHDVDDLWKKLDREAAENLARFPPANAYSGRSVKVMNGNVAESYRRLEMILSRNKVRAQLRLTERHEKKGVKRRRLSSERWRKQFANEVRKKVQLVTQIRNRGA